MATAVKRPFGRDEVVEALLDAANRLFVTDLEGESFETRHDAIRRSLRKLLE